MAHVELDPFLKLVIRMGRQGGPVYADHYSIAISSPSLNCG